jgi:2-polyprenyl-6-methoxyphenol hydroxylase-like FAD-dependent oxidoreductase
MKITAMHTDVLIVGAGPTGLTLAVDLVRRGVSVAVVEAAAQPPHQSRGKGLQPRTLEVFDDLGVVDAVLEYGAWRQECCPSHLHGHLRATSLVTRDLE